MSDFKELLKVHQENVKKMLSKSAEEFSERGRVHDEDKLTNPLINEAYEKYFPQLKKIEFNTKEYKDFEKEHFAEAHFAHVQNRHHFYDHRNQMTDVNLFDLIEAIIDINESSKQYNPKHNQIDLLKTIENKGITQLDLTELIANTLSYLEKDTKNT